MSAWGIAPGNRLALDKALKGRVSSALSSNELAPKNEWRFQRYIVFRCRRILGCLPQALNERCAFGAGAKRMRAMSSPNQQSLHGYALGEIPWFIDVAAQFDG